MTDEARRLYDCFESLALAESARIRAAERVQRSEHSDESAPSGNAATDSPNTGGYRASEGGES